MNKCVNIKNPAFIELVNQSGLNPAVLSAKMGVWMENNDSDEWPTLDQLNISTTQSGLNYILKVINALDKISRNIFEQSKLQGWINDLQKQGVSKEQIEFFKETAKDGMTKDEIIASIAANYTYTVEVNITKDNKKTSDEFFYNGNNYGYEVIGDDYGTGAEDTVPTRNGIEISQQEFDEAKNAYRRDTNISSQFYSNLTVPGGTNYTENEISTPLITPSIKGHAQFSTDQGIGWFRSDEQVKGGKFIEGTLYEEGDNFEDLRRPFKETQGGSLTKTRRILEIQSDLFQKGRNLEGLTDYRSVSKINETENSNQFLRLLNKDNNWVTFFIKSIIQDSAKKGYEKVLFPKGETAAKIEGHETLEIELVKINREIEQVKRNGLPFGSTQEEENQRIKELEQRKSELKSQGIEKLKPIEAFYEIKVGNILKKIDPNIKIITDEYDNQWYEYILSTKDLTESIKLRNLTSDEIKSNIENRFIEEPTVPISNIEDTINNLIEQNPILEDLLEKVKPIAVEQKLKIVEVSKEDIKGANATYDNSNKIIKTTTNNSDDILHEIGHFITFNAWINYPTSNYFKEISKLYEYAILKNPELKQRYAFTNLEEFISETLGSSYLQRDLVKIKIEDDFESVIPDIGKHINILDRIISFLTRLTYKFLNIEYEYNKENVYNAVIDLTTKTFTTPESYYDLSKKEGIKEKRGPITNEEVVGDIKSLMDKVSAEISERIVKEDLSDLDRLAEIKRKSIAAIESKLELQIKKKIIVSEGEIERREEFIQKLNKLEAEEAMILFTKQAAESTNRIYKEWLDINKKIKDIKEGTLDKELKDVITPGKLYAWKDFLSAYDSIEEFQTYLLDDDRLDTITYKDDSGKTIRLKDVLADTILKKNDIRKLYDVLGLELSASDLSQYYNKVYKDFEIQMSKSYDSLSSTDKEKISKEDYIKVLRERKESDLKQETRLLFRKELLKANKDINLASRWAGVLLDSSDPVIAAMAKRMITAEIETNSKKIKFRDKIIPLMKELEGFLKGKNMTMKDLYDFMLEKDSKGNYTGYTINKFTSDFWNAYEAKRQELRTNETLSVKERKKELKEWRKQYTTFRDREFGEAKWNYINSLLEQGIINDTEYKELELNDQIYDSKNTYELYEAGILSRESSDLIGTWIAENLWEYIDPDKENSQWNKLKQILKNPNDPRTKFYNFIKEMEDEANSYLSPSMKLLHGKLPAIVKTGKERFEEGESPIILFKESMRRWFDVLPDDTTRGNEPIMDEQGNLRYFVPMYFTGELRKYQIIDNKSKKLIKEFGTKAEAENYISKQDNPNLKIETRRALEDQSFDIATMYFRFYSAAVDYHSKNSILPEMEMAKYFVNNREVTRTDPSGNPIKKIFRVTKEEGTESKPGKGGRLAEQLNDWFEMVFYGVKENKEGRFKIFGMDVDVAKLANAISKFTSLNILALNFRAGVANTILGEALQLSEAFAKQHMTLKSYNKANIYYTNHLPGIIGDVGRIKKESIINMLYEHFNIPTEPVDTKLRDNTRIKKLANFSSLYFFMTAGDNYMQTRMFLGMLDDKKAYDKDGNLLGSMLDQYQKDNKGKLILKKEVDIIKSKWTKEDQDNFASKVKGVLSGVHGEYSDLGRLAIQRMSIGRMAIMFRKFISPGITKRYKKNSYVERVGDYTEGYYRTTARFISNLARELKTYQFAVFGEEWNKLSDIEKSNIRRTSAEIAFLILAYVMANVFLSLGEDDDKWVYDFAAYQMLRFKTELWFYINPAEAQKILRSPAATMSLFENTLKLFHQIFHPLERYDRGLWDEHLKLEKIMWDYIPAFRSFYQTKDIKSQINFVR